MKFDYEKQPGMDLWNRPLVKTGKPLISIITAFYNTPGNIFKQTYNCVINQTFPWFEWIIVDDGSKNKEALETLECLAKLDRRIRIIRQDNMGLSTARNVGINNANTEFIFPLDSDDLLEPTYLEYAFWALYFNQKAAWSYADMVGFQDEEYTWVQRFDPEREKTENLLSATALIRKKAIIEAGMYNVQNFPFNEDWHLWLSILSNGGYPVQMTGEFLFWYRRTKKGVLGAVTENKENRVRNKKLIEEQASYVIDPKSPIIYPSNSCEQFKELHESDWTQSIYSEHRKIHVLFLFPWLIMGGADKFNLDLLTGLDNNKYEVSIITTQRSDNEWLQRFREVTPEIFNLPNFLSPNNYAEFIDYFLKSREIDLIFQSNSIEGYYLLPWIRKNHPEIAIVDYVHMEEWYWRNGGHARTSCKFSRFIERTYVCNSATKKVMLEYFHRMPDEVETVHIGIDEKRFDASRIHAGKLYEELEIDKNRPIILFICRLHPQKRPFLMLKIAEYVKEKIPNVAFVVVGDGSLEGEMKQKCQSRGLDETVFFVGSKSEVRPYYRDAKVTLICSMKEGLALTAYESLAMGIPVVSADVGGQKDLIDDTVGALIPLMQDEKDDFDSRTFPKEEISAYGKAIVSILSDESTWKTMSRNCRKKIEEGFTIGAMTDYFNVALQRIVRNDNLLLERKKISQAIAVLGAFSEEAFLLNQASGLPDQPKDNFIRENSSEVMDAIWWRLGQCEEVLNRHEEVVNRHEEVVNRHEEVVNRHEKSINHQWEVQKWHEERIQALERRSILRRIKNKLFR